MPLLWREQLSVGNNVIDEDHRYLIEIINQVEKSLAAKSRSELVKELDNLARYSLLHFEREERIAKAVGYAQVDHLSSSHESLMKNLDKVRVEFDAAGQEWSTEAAEHFTKFLRGWLIEHVIKEDLLMKPVLQKFSPAYDPR